jgi:anti-sigma B factor antagonist
MSLAIELHNQNNISIFELKGRILSDSDLVEPNNLLTALKDWNIIFDLSQLTHTNSSGIAFMVKSMTRARINNGDVVLVNPNTGLSKLFEITKMHEVFTIYETLETAKNHFKH